MSELYRVAKANARFVLRFRASPGSREDTLRSLTRFAQPAQSPASNYLADWQPVRIKLIVDAGRSGEENEAEPPGEAAVKEVLVELRAVKPARPRDPGLLEVPEPTFTRSAIDLESIF